MKTGPTGIVMEQSEWSMKVCSGVAILTVSAVLFCGLIGNAVAQAYYLDVNGSDSGFGDPSGAYTSAQSVWTTTSDGTGLPAALPASQLNFGFVGTEGVSNSTFSVSSSATLRGIAVNVPCNFTLTAFGAPDGGGQSWTVVEGATFNYNVGLGNLNNKNITLRGGGTINFNGSIGYNDTKTVKQDMDGGVVNVNTNWTGGSGNQADYDLTLGTLNFATPSSADAFSSTGRAGRSFILRGGTLDNTSGADLMLNLGSASYAIGGNFTFTGSSSLDLNTNSVNLFTTGTREITVSANTLTIGGAITNKAGLVKAGAGTLTLSGTNSTYSGGTTISSGTLLVEGGIGGAVNVVGGLLGGTGTISGTVTNGATMTAAGTNSVGTLTIGGLVMNENSTCVWNYNETTNDVIQVNGSLTLPAVATVDVRRVTSGRLPVRGVLFNGFTEINTGELSGWIITGAAPNTVAEVDGSQVVLVTPPVGTFIQIR